jgi:hypothetical protein
LGKDSDDVTITVNLTAVLDLVHRFFFNHGILKARGKVCDHVETEENNNIRMDALERYSHHYRWLKWLVTGISLRKMASVTVLSILDLWWTKWHWNTLFSDCFGFPRQYHSTNTHHSSTVDAV